MSSQFEKRKIKNKIKDIEDVQSLVEFDGEALDIIYDNEQHKFIQIVVLYNLETGLAKVSKVEAVADSQPVAIHKIQKHFVDKILFLRK